ncbi:hypothetical protein D3C76_593170 [compost metagenome]
MVRHELDCLAQVLQRLIKLQFVKFQLAQARPGATALGVGMDSVLPGVARGGDMALLEMGRGAGDQGVELVRIVDQHFLGQVQGAFKVVVFVAQQRQQAAGFIVLWFLLQGQDCQWLGLFGQFLMVQGAGMQEQRGATVLGTRVVPEEVGGSHVVATVEMRESGVVDNRWMLDTGLHRLVAIGRCADEILGHQRQVQGQGAELRVIDGVLLKVFEQALAIARVTCLDRQVQGVCQQRLIGRVIAQKAK